MKLGKVFGGLGLFVLLLLDQRNGSTKRKATNSEARSSPELDHWTFNRELVTVAAIVGMTAALWLPAFRRDDPAPLLSQASVFIGLTSSIVMTIVSIGAVLVVLPYGSSKNRTDTAAALVVFGLLTIVSWVALYLYSDYRSLLVFCEPLGENSGEILPTANPRVGQPVLACDEFSLSQARQIAPDLERITTLSSVGQLIPLLSVSKDIFQAWFSPPGLGEQPSTSATRRAARRERRLSTPRTKLSYAPVVVVLILYAGQIALPILLR